MRIAVGVAAALGLATALAGIALAVAAFAPVPFADSIDFYNRFYDSGGWDGYGFAELYARHNEHRLVVPRLWFLLDLAAFDGTQAFLIAVIVLTSAVHGVVLAGLFRSLGHRGAVAWAFAAMALGAVLSPAQWENLVWGFQVQFVQVWLFATLAFVAVACGDPHRAWWRVAVAIVCGLASTYSMANGILVWPLLIGLALWRGLAGGPFSLLVLAGVAVIGIEASGYQSHPGHGDPMETLRQPIALLRYASRYLTVGISEIGTTGQEILGAVLVAFILATAVDAIVRRQRYRPAHGVLLAIAGFVIGAALLTGLGRVTFGLGQANAGRYATPSFIFLLVACALLLDRLAVVERRRAVQVAVAGMAVVLLVPGMVGSALRLSSVIADRDARINTIVTYLAGGYRPQTLNALYPFLPIVPFHALQELERRAAGPFADASQFMPPQDLRAGPLRGAEQPCRGHLDSAVVDPVYGIQISGWAAAPDGVEQPAWVLAVDRFGSVVGWGASRAERPDVGQAIGSGRWGRGFHAVGSKAVDGPLTVIGAFSDGRLCRIGDPLSPLPRFLPTRPADAEAAADRPWAVSEGDAQHVGPDVPADIQPAVGSLGPVSRLAASLDLNRPDGEALLLVPVRTGSFPIGVSIAVRDAETGQDIDRHAFGRPSDHWTWLVLRGTQGAPGRPMRLHVTAEGPQSWRGVAVGRPYWLAVGAGG